MAHPTYQNQGNALARFVEESGEALAAAGKTARFGFDSSNPEKPGSETNEQWLQREILDVESAIARLRRERGWKNLPEEDRQMVLLALAELALSRPGWDDTLGRIADGMQGRPMFDEFKRLNADRVKESRGDLAGYHVGVDMASGPDKSVEHDPEG